MNRFDRLGMLDQMLLVTLMAATATFLFPGAAAAQTTYQTPVVFEINNLNTKLQQLTSDKPNPEALAAQTEIKPVTVATAVKRTIYSMPPKVTGDARVYMQEPEIRAYICPKVGDKCNIFMAVLAAENGTHECTRDNRGLNRNGSVDIGLAQINWTPSSPYTFEQLQDCKFNLDVALSMYARRGFQPWYAYTKGAYLSHLAAVTATAAIVAPTEPVAITN